MISAAEEAHAHATYVKALLNSDSEDAVLTEAFSVGWPNAPHRVIRSSLEAAQSFKGNIVVRRKLSNGGDDEIRLFESVTATDQMT